MTILYEPWAEGIRETYARTEAAMFVLHNNIHDVFPFGGEYLTSRQYLERMLERGNYVTITYDLSRGMRFANDGDAAEFVRLANLGRESDAMLIRSIYDLPKDSVRALAYIEAFIVGVQSTERPVAVILDYAEQLAPNSAAHTGTEVDRVNAVTLQRFATLFYERLADASARDAVCFALTQNLHDLHPELTRSELVIAVDVPRPGPTARANYLKWSQAQRIVEGKPPLALSVSEDAFVELTSGLTLTGIRHLLLRAESAVEGSGGLSSAFIMDKKRDLIERDSRGMLEVLSPKHGLDAVGGNEQIKRFLRLTANDLKAGLSDVPVGMVCPGPNGVGKTFIAKAFARDSGLNCVMLKNFRGMYVGQTEANLDIIFNILKSMTPNVVILDEADKMLGNETDSGANKVDDRVFGAFTAFMGDPEYRGKIFWVLLTARPFNLAPDTGRPGRVEEHVPILAPETYDEKRAILDAVMHRCGIELVDDDDATLKTMFDDLGFVTPAALELICNRARRGARRAHGDAVPTARVQVSVPALCFEATHYVPEGSASKLRLQTLEAVLYTNHLSYLPEPWRTRLRDDSDGLAQEREALRRLVGYS